MSTSTYLQLCQDTQSTCSITGNLITSVANQTGILKKLVRWVADADVVIQRMHTDWDFLYDTSTFSETIVQGSSQYSKPSDIGQWDRKTFWLNRSLATNQQLFEMEYRDYFNNYAPGVQTQGSPANFIVAPTKHVLVYPEPDNGTYTLTANYWKTPVRMAADGDVSVIPENYIRAIIARAKMYYAIDQEAPEVYSEANGEFQEVMYDLKCDQLPGFQDNNKSDDVELTVIPV